MENDRCDRRSAKRWPRSAFTLIELLVVVAILTILAAILFPVFGQVRAKAHQATCLSNLRQIGQAGMMYIEDHDERFPSCFLSATPPFYQDPRFTLQGYIKNWDILYCPNRLTVREECLDPAEGFRPNSRCMGYGYNWGSGLVWGRTITEKADGLVRYYPGPPEVIEGVGLVEVIKPSRTFFYGDTNDYLYITLLRDVMPGVKRDENATSGPATNQFGMPYEPPRHGEANCFVFVDGHADCLRFHGGRWRDGGPWVVTDMSMYSRTGQWEVTNPP